jgi:hypothetical protein
MSTVAAIPHRILDYAPTSRLHCAGHCGKTIPEGNIRFGTMVEIMNHQSMSYRCVDCVTERQAVNLVRIAEGQKQCVKEFLTLPPPPDAGGEGVEDVVADLFVRYVDALIAGDKGVIKNIQQQLHRHHRRVEGDRAVQVARHTDMHALDAQIRNDLDVMNLLTHDDLRALADHHGIKGPIDGMTKPELELALKEIYAPNDHFDHGPNHVHDGRCHTSPKKRKEAEQPENVKESKKKKRAKEIVIVI